MCFIIKWPFQPSPKGPVEFEKERIVMEMRCLLGTQSNLVSPGQREKKWQPNPERQKQVMVDGPISQAKWHQDVSGESNLCCKEINSVILCTKAVEK